MAHGYSSGWTYRQGRTYYQPGERRSGGGGLVGGCCAAIFCSVFLIAIPFMAWTAETAYHDMLVAFDEVKDHIIMLEPGCTSDISACAPKNSLIHLSSDSVSGSVEDPDFGVSVSAALKLHRQVEYCQWQETKTEKCETCSRQRDGKEETYSCNCVTTYHYIKGWRSHRIISTFFDQPAAHHNPQRDPFPPSAFPSNNARLGKTAVLPELIANPHHAFRASSRGIEWTRGAQREPRWYDSILKFFNFRLGGTTRYEEVENLRGAENSAAARKHNFVYVGQGGYFFSPYEASQYEQLFKYFVEFLEGSLLDWQIGDIMPSCTAGDIRVHYAVQDPQEVSVVAGVAEGRSGAALGLFRTSRDYELGILHEGFSSAYDMFDKEAWEGKKWCLLWRLLLLPCCWAFAHAIAAFSGVEFTSFKAAAAATVAVEGVLISVAWSLIWKFQFASLLQHLAMVLLGVISVGLGAVAMKQTQPSPYGSGFGNFVEWYRDVFGIRSPPVEAAPTPQQAPEGKED